MMCQECNSVTTNEKRATFELGQEQACECPTGLSGRYVQPCLLLVLSQKDSYGYEMISEVQKLGATADPSAVYRTLRKMESEGLVKSEWNTEGVGPAKRFYKITPEGEDFLHSWVVVLKGHKESLEQFLEKYYKKIRKEVR